MKVIDTMIEAISNETKATTIKQRQEQREELLHVYSQYYQRYSEYAKKLGRTEGEFPTMENKVDLAKILFPGFEFFYYMGDDNIVRLLPEKEKNPKTYYLGVSLPKDSMQAVNAYCDASYSYGIPVHIEFWKDNSEKSDSGFCKAWHLFTQSIEVSKAEELVNRILNEADLRFRMIFSGHLDADQMIFAINDFAYPPMKDDAQFIDPKTFHPYDTWQYLLNVVSEEAVEDRKGMIKPEWVDQALQMNRESLDAKKNEQPEQASNVDADLGGDSANELFESLTSGLVQEAKPENAASKEAVDDEPFDEDAVRKFFRRLNHSNYGLTELVVYSPQTNKLLASGFFKEEDAFVKCCRQWDGKANIYAGRNPRPFDFAENLGLEIDRLYTDRKSRASDRNIGWMQAMVLDIDPIRSKGTSSTDEQHEAALAFAEKIAKDIGGSVDDSGNGSYVWIPINPIKINDENMETIKAKCKAWEAQIRERYQTEDCGMKIDPVFELSRILKVVGTLSVKGEIHRRSKFHTPPVFEPHPSLDQTILDISVEIKDQANVHIAKIGNQLPEKFTQLLKNDEGLKIHWDTPNKDDDASSHDWRLGLLCLDSGITDQNALATIISLNPNGKIQKKGKDDSYIKVTVSELIKQWEPRNATANPKDAIQAIIRSTKSAYMQKSRISRFIYQDLQKRGEFIKTRDDHFYFLLEDKKLMEIPDSVDFKSMLNKLYDMVETEPFCQFILAELKAKCHLYGRETIIHRFCVFDKSAFKLYIDRFDGQVYILDGDQIRLVDNGTDGVLFAFDELAEPYEVSDHIKGGLFDLYITQRINFETNTDTNISISEQRLLLQTWIWNMFFETISPTKPLLLIYGAKGSGKTSIAKTVGKLLFGNKFDVSSVSDDQRDFDALVSNKYLIVLDNLDIRRPWLTDRLAKAATGQAIEMRELYTTNNLARYFPKCYIIITARTPQIRQDDVADRLLILNVKRFENFIPESTLLNDVIKNRNEILSELFHQLNWCIRRLKENKDNEYSGSFRMADFANFGYKIYNGDEAFLETLRKMDRAQNEFLLEEDTLVEFLNLWLDNPSNQNRAVKSLELLSELKKIAKDKDLEFIYRNPTSLSMRLRNQEKNLQQFFKFTIDIGPGRANLFKFEKKDPNDNS
jgi:hypothetical protein